MTITPVHADWKVPDEIAVPVEHHNGLCDVIADEYAVVLVDADSLGQKGALGTPGINSRYIKTPNKVSAVRFVDLQLITLLCYYVINTFSDVT